MSNRRDHAVFAVVLLSLAMLLVMRFDWAVDEAKQAGLTAAHFRMAEANYFRDMDGGVDLPRDEIIGRNMWMVWTGGNDRFWDGFSRLTFGSFDLLKIVSTNPYDPTTERGNRWTKYGVVNEPCFLPATGPDEYGLWLDVRDPACPADDFASADNYPGVQIGARGKTVPVGSYYGRPTGIVGLRLFPNPDFDERAMKVWCGWYPEEQPVNATKRCEPERYRCPPDSGKGGKPTDDCRIDSSTLVRPYRVGMSCAFCHAGPIPTRAPQDPANPKWSNLGSIVGAQFMNIREVFLPNLDDESFITQILKTYKQGVLDTSLVPADSINNPRTMNAIYALPERMELAKRLGEEKLSGGALLNKQFNDFPNSGSLAEFFKAPDTVHTPHIIKDGADSVGPLGALNRVYVNIGMFSEQWLKHFNPVIGGLPVSPFEIRQAQANSVYWQVTEANTVNIAQYFMRVSKPDRLAETEAGAAILKPDAEAAEEGKTVFARTCARCHSSKGPQAPDGIRNCRVSGKDHLTCFKGWWNWTKTDDYKAKMTTMVRDPNFAIGNYLSSDVRVPVTLLRTNACSAVAPNAIAGGVWDNFSSQTYKDLPPVGSVSVRDPFTGAYGTFELPGGGRGYLRPPSLINVWATAPFLLNNSLGRIAESPSIADRLLAFDDAARQLLWPEQRAKDEKLKDLGVYHIDRVTRDSSVRISDDYLPLPPFLLELRKVLLDKKYDVYFPKEGGMKLGPVPEGLPVNLIANTSVAPSRELFNALSTLVSKIDEGTGYLARDPRDQKGRQYDHYASLAPTLLKLSNCKDFEVNRGHYFGTAQFNDTTGLTEDEKAFVLEPEPVLSDKEKNDLIAYLKTL